MPSNLPPGVSVNDIPGNRPEDDDEDAFWAELDKKLAEVFGGKKPDGMPPIDGDWPEWLCTTVRVARDLGYTRGYNEGTNDAQLAHDLTEGQEELCTCTLACIPQGMTEGQVCRLSK